MKRLFWLMMAALVAGGAVTAKAADGCPAEKLGWQLAVHSYTFKNFSILDAIEKTKSIGLSYMSISGGVSFDAAAPDPKKQKRISTHELSAEDWGKIRAKLDACGIKKVVNIGVVKLPPDEAKSRAVFEFAKKNGIEILVSEPEAAALDVVDKLCKEYNIKVAIHNHPGPKNIYWKPELVLEALKGRSPLMGACVDVGHWVRSGLDPIESLKKMEGKILAVHFKDLNAKNPTSDPKVKLHDVPWGTGVSNGKGMLAEFKRQGFRGAFCVEYEHNWDTSLPEIAESAKWFNAQCAELAK